jgi:hypothetical protein
LFTNRNPFPIYEFVEANQNGGLIGKTNSAAGTEDATEWKIEIGFLQLIKV